MIYYDDINKIKIKIEFLRLRIWQKNLLFSKVPLSYLLLVSKLWIFFENLKIFDASYQNFRKVNLLATKSWFLNLWNIYLFEIFGWTFWLIQYQLRTKIAKNKNNYHKWGDNIIDYQVSHFEHVISRNLLFIPFSFLHFYWHNIFTN